MAKEGAGSTDQEIYDVLRALEEALLAYPGCVMVISHDRWFLDRIATHILAVEDDGSVIFTGQVALGAPAWTSQHRVLDTPIFPATGWLELALTVGLSLGLSRIEQLTLTAPLIVTEAPAVIQVVVSAADERVLGRAPPVLARRPCSRAAPCPRAGAAAIATCR